MCFFDSTNDSSSEISGIVNREAESNIHVIVHKYAFTFAVAHSDLVACTLRCIFMAAYMACSLL